MLHPRAAAGRHRARVALRRGPVAARHCYLRTAVLRGARRRATRLERLLDLDYVDRAGARRRSCASDAAERIVGVSRYARIEGTTRAECAIVVADDWQGCGLGTELMRSLAQAARRARLHLPRGRDARRERPACRLGAPLRLRRADASPTPAGSCGSRSSSSSCSADLESRSTRLDARSRSLRVTGRIASASTRRSSDQRQQRADRAMRLERVAQRHCQRRAGRNCAGPVRSRTMTPAASRSLTIFWTARSVMPTLARDVAQPRVAVERQADQHVRVVAQERPVAGRRRQASAASRADPRRTGNRSVPRCLKLQFRFFAFVLVCARTSRRATPRAAGGLNPVAVVPTEGSEAGPARPAWSTDSS